jgi:hypothetical protein
MFSQGGNHTVFEMPSCASEFKQRVEVSANFIQGWGRKQLWVNHHIRRLACCPILVIEIIVQIVLERSVDDCEVVPLRRPKTVMLQSVSCVLAETEWPVR